MHRRIQPIKLGGAKLPISSESRPEEPKPKTQRTKSRRVVRGEGGSQPLHDSYEFWGSAVSSPVGSRTEPQPLKGFLAF